MTNNKLIEKYLDGLLNKEEQIVFDEKIKYDPVFLAELKLNQDINTAILQFDKVGLLSKKIKAAMNLNRQTPGKTKLIRYIAPAAAVGALLIVWQQFGANNTNKIYSKLYKPYVIDIHERSIEGGDTGTEFGLVLYQNGEYESAYQVFQNYLKENYNNQNIQFFSALCALELSKTEEAITTLSQISADSTSLFSIQAKWFLALVYIKEKDLKKASVELKYLKENSKEYGNNAAELLDKNAFSKIN